MHCKATSFGRLGIRSDEEDEDEDKDDDGEDIGFSPCGGGPGGGGRLSSAFALLFITFVMKLLT